MPDLSVPESEIDTYQCITINRLNLRNFTRAFQTAVALFTLLERGGGPPSVGVFGGVFTQYRLIAAKDGVLNLYHVKCCLTAIKKQLPKCPSLASKVDAVAVRNALKTFNLLFPNCDNVRNAIAHAAEIFQSPREMKKHSYRGNDPNAGIGPGVWLGASLYERTYKVGIEGNIFAVSLDDLSITKLIHVISLVDSAFQAVDAQNAQQS